MTDADISRIKPQIWAGVECAHVHMRSRTADQLTATGHRERLEDIDLLASLGVSAVRYPVLWGWPAGSRGTDWTWARQRLDALTDRGVRPIVGLLHHGYGPKQRSALDPDWPKAFAQYAGTVARRFPYVDSYLPINEPLTTARFAGLYGWWPPYATNREVFVRLIVAQCLAIRAAIREIRKVRSDVTLVVNEDSGKTYGTRQLRSVVDFDNNRRWLTFDLLTGRVDSEHPLWEYLTGVKSARRGVASLRDDPEPPDILGIDYYVTSDRYVDHRLELYPSTTHGGNGSIAYADVEVARVDGLEIDGFARSLQETWRRYRIPVALTEVDLAGEDSDKVAWWLEAWRAASDALGNGIAVAGVTAWSVFGAIDWGSVLRDNNGAYEPGAFDVRVSPPRKTRIGQLIASTALRSSMSGTPPRGWWRRPDRVLYGLPTSTSRPTARRGRESAPQEAHRIRAHHARDDRVSNSGA